MDFKIITPYTVKYGEFPNLLLGTSNCGAEYFDATHFINCKGDTTKHSVSDFFVVFNHWVQAIRESYDLSQEEVVRTDPTTGHLLIDEAFALLFVSYIEPDFCVHIIEQMFELFMNGIAISDTRLLRMAEARFIENNFKKTEVSDGEKRFVQTT